jgi:hypothetical protein
MMGLTVKQNLLRKNIQGLGRCENFLDRNWKHNSMVELIPRTYKALGVIPCTTKKVSELKKKFLDRTPKAQTMK